MKRIIIDSDDCNTIRLSDVSENRPIFAKRNNEFVGMIVKEIDRIRISNANWILRIGGSAGATGHHLTLEKCLRSCIRACSDCEFFV